MLSEHGKRVPAPPSLDSLHQMAKVHSEGRKGQKSSKEEGGQGQMESSMSDSTAGPQSPVASSSANSDTRNTGVRLDPNYTRVRDCIDTELDADPNYESVEEAKSKVFEIKSSKSHGTEGAASSASVNTQANHVNTKPPKRDHVYEEVKPSEAAIVKSRVLRSHMYEDIVEVQEQKRELDRKSQDLSKSKNGKKK